MSRFYELTRQAQPDEPLLITDDKPRLTPSRSLPSSAQQGFPRELDASHSDWSRALGAIQKHWRKSAIFAGSVIVFVILLTILTKPVYSPVARVEVDPPGAELFSLEGRGGPESAPDYLETQARNMQSDQLLILVMGQLQLDQVPEFTRKGFASRAMTAVFSPIEGMSSSIWRRDRASTPSGAESEILTPVQASTLRAMQERLSVERDTASRLISISFTTHDPVLSATITNNLVRSFIERSYQTRHTAIMESTQWLSRQLDDIRAKMEASNTALADFQRTSGIADIDQNRSTVSEQVGELTRQKTLAQEERIQIESYLNRTRSNQVDTLPQIQNNQVVQLLSQKLAETRAELSQTLAIYGRNHPNAKRLANESQELEAQIQLQRNAIVAQMETSHGAALLRERMLDEKLRGTTRELGQVARYAELKRETQANSDLYNNLYARVKEAGIAAASKSINVRIVDQARVLDRPSSPRPLVNLGIGLAVALMGGIFIAFVFEAFDTRVRTLEDIRRSVGVSSISMIPIADGSAHLSMTGALSSVLGLRPNLLDRPALFCVNQPASEQSEAFRSIHTSLMLSQPDSPPRILLVASSLPGEGKTTVAVNVAAMLAQRAKTCLLDADLRRPALARTFSLNNSRGLGDYLTGASALESLYSSIPDLPALTVIAGGKTVTDPGRCIATNEMRLLLQKLSARFDFIVIDSPPILPYSDGRVLAALVDGVIFVARAGEVTRAALSRSMELLEQVHSAPIIEIVLNGAETESNRYGYGYKYPQSA